MIVGAQNAGMLPEIPMAIVDVCSNQNPNENISVNMTLLAKELDLLLGEYKAGSEIRAKTIQINERAIFS